MKHINRTGIYSSAQIAELFGIAERHVWRYLNTGTLPGRKIGKHWFCTGQDILSFISGGNQTDTAHKRSAWHPADKAQDSRAEHTEQTPTPGTIPTVTPAAPAAVTAHTSDNAPTATPAVNAHATDSHLTPRQQRRKAVMDAYTATGSYQAAADALNQQIVNGGPRPERGDRWTAERVRQTVFRLRRRA